MPRVLGLLVLCAAPAFAVDTKVSFTLNTTDAYGAPVQQSRYYWVTRPDGLAKTQRAPMVLVFEAAANGGPGSVFRSKAAEAGFLIVACSFSGNSTGTPGSVWVNDNSSFAGPEDYDYTSEVIRRVRESENGGDAFVVGLSKGGHMSLAYAAERPSTIRAAVSVDEFIQAWNLPTAPLPVMVMQGTQDTNVPFTMSRDTLEVWRAENGLLGAAPETTFEASPLQPGRVTRTTWRGPGGAQAAFVTIVGGTHTYATPDIQTGYDSANAIWAFFSQFLTPAQDAPKIVSQPVANVQFAGGRASFRVVANAALPVRYQWQRNGAEIAGATDSVYTTPALTVDDSGATYRAVVSNAAGTVTSAAAMLTVKSATLPVVAMQPAGQTVTFSAAAGAASYQWNKNGMPIAGATDATVTLPAVAIDSGAAITVTAGGATSAPAILTAMPAAGAPIVLQNPTRVRTLVDQPATFSITAWSATPVTYQWQKGTFTGNMADIAGATSPTVTFARPALSDHLTLVRCVVSNAAGSTVSASEMLFVTAAVAPPNQIVSPIRAAGQAGAAFRYDVVATGGTAPLAYSAAPLPPGLAIDPVSGRISGTPSTAGVTNVTIAAANSAGKTSETLILTIGAVRPPVSIEEWRAANFGASAVNADIAGDDADPDGDGCSNRREFEGGADPLDAGSVPAGLPVGRRGRAGCPRRPGR